jgi:hypothetical protein
MEGGEGGGSTSSPWASDAVFLGNLAELVILYLLRLCSIQYFLSHVAFFLIISFTFEYLGLL